LLSASRRTAAGFLNHPRKRGLRSGTGPSIFGHLIGLAYGGRLKFAAGCEINSFNF
jgi:hypothetical protein